MTRRSSTPTWGLVVSRTESTKERPILEVTGLSSGYGEIEAIHQLGLHVNAGEVVTIIGANGAGKTTLMTTLMGRLPARSGIVRLRGEDITRHNVHERVQRGLTLVPEGRETLAPLTVEENLRLARKRGRRGERVPSTHAVEQLDVVYTLFPQLRERRRQRAGSMSGGEQQMLAVGRALMAGPQVLMLDEPSLGLAPKVVEHVFAALAELRDTGLPMVLVEQDAFLALEFADRGYVLETGRFRTDGDSSSLLNSEAIASAYLGIPPEAETVPNDSQGGS